MARCSGCSLSFSLLPSGRQCGSCVRFAASNNPDLPAWPQCTKCGNVYRFLANDICNECIEFSKCYIKIASRSPYSPSGPAEDGGTQEVVCGAVANPANPRTHTNHRGRSSHREPSPEISEDEAQSTVRFLMHSFDLYAHESHQTYRGGNLPPRSSPLWDLHTQRQLRALLQVFGLLLLRSKVLTLRFLNLLPRRSLHEEERYY